MRKIWQDFVLNDEIHGVGLKQICNITRRQKLREDGAQTFNVSLVAVGNNVSIRAVTAIGYTYQGAKNGEYKFNETLKVERKSPHI